MKIFFLFLFAGVVNSFDVKCLYKSIGFKGENFYSCSFGYIKNPSDNHVVNITGDLSKQKRLTDVKGITVTSCVFNTLPTGFENKFPNIELISFPKVDLISITRENLKVFTKLRIINLEGNKIESIEKSLFDDNLNLEKIYFTENKIKFVGENVLKPLQKLKVADFSGNQCISTRAENTNAVKSLNFELNYKCFDYVAIISEKVSPLERKLNESESKNKALEQKILSLQGDINHEQLKHKREEEEAFKRQSDMEKRVEQLKQSLSLQSNSSQLEEELRKLYESQDKISSTQSEANSQLTLLKEEIDRLRSQLNDQSLNFTSIIEEMSSKIGGSESTLNEIVEGEEMAESFQEMSDGVKNYKEMLQTPQNEAPESHEILPATYQAYIFIFLCVLFTITTTIFILVVVSSREKNYYLREIDMKNFNDSLS